LIAHQSAKLHYFDNLWTFLLNFVELNNAIFYF